MVVLLPSLVQRRCSSSSLHTTSRRNSFRYTIARVAPTLSCTRSRATSSSSSTTAGVAPTPSRTSSSSSTIHTIPGAAPALSCTSSSSKISFHGEAPSHAVARTLSRGSSISSRSSVHGEPPSNGVARTLSRRSSTSSSSSFHAEAPGTPFNGESPTPSSRSRSSSSSNNSPSSSSFHGEAPGTPSPPLLLPPQHLPLHHTHLQRVLCRLDLHPSPLDPATYASLLQTCGKLKALPEGKRVHAHIIRSGRQRDMFLANHLVNMYGKCGSLEDARRTFDQMHRRNVVSCTAMIAAYAQHGRCDQALQVFRQMQLEGVKPNKVTFVAVLNACASPGALAEGKIIHACITESGLESHVIVGTALVSMYGKCGSLEDARRIFDNIHERNVVLWTALITAYAQHGRGKEALQLFKQMQLEGVKPDKITFASVLNACSSLAVLAQGKMIHALIVESGFEADMVVGNALVDMYSKCGSVKDARRIFDEMQRRDVVSWNAMIATYAQHGDGKEALQLFQRMQQEGRKPDKFTFVSVLSACACLAALSEGKMIHALIVKGGFESNVIVGNAVINMYGKCGNVDDARKMFNKMHQRSVVSWSAMIAAYAQHGHGNKALQLFRRMQLEGVQPNSVTFLAVLDACANLAALARGKKIHAHIVESGFESDVVVGNALVNMYGKCGSVKDAQNVFEKMHKRDVVSWNAMIDAYAQHGDGKEALHLFRQMQLEGVKPNGITFVSILSACSHAGLVDEGCRYFDFMNEDHDITPMSSHYGCMIDLFGRAGQLDEAEDFMNKMPFQPDVVMWMTLLGACRNHGDVERGKRAAEHVLMLDPQYSSAYVVLSNIYAAAGRWGDATKVRKLMVDRGVKKQPGCSSIEIKSNMHEFVAGDRSHPQTEQIYAELGRLIRQMKDAGYVPDTKLVLHDVEEEKKEEMLYCHSEKLAIAFGLISTPLGRLLRIVKNLRVCSDCHTFIKFISKIVGREIVVRDATRFHHFMGGMCSCRDFW